MNSRREHVAIATPPAKGMGDTPELLADTLIRAVGVADADSWLDPSAGSGQLVRAALRAGVPSKSILAIDLQTQLPSLERLGVKSLLGTDFLHWAQQTGRRFDRVVANPPFVRLSQLEEALLRPALETRLNGINITAIANYWVAFLIAGMRLLKPDGSLAYVLPAAWEYADYASSVRSLCAESFQELDVHRVATPMFDGISDGCVLLVGRGFGRRPHREPQVIRHTSLPVLNRAVCTNEFPAAIGRMREHDPSLPEGQIHFGKIARIGIGAVTGDARFFLFNEARRRHLRLPRSAVRPVLSKARHLISSEIDDDTWARLLATGNRVWLFDPSESDLSHPAVQTYLTLTAEDGGCRRDAAKVRLRYPWYRVHIPDRFDGFVTGMSQSMPWVALNRMPNLTASNTLYGVRFPRIKSIEEQAAWCLSILSSTTVKSRAELAREYPQGLLKLEPSDIARLAVRRPITTTGTRELYRKATELIRTGQPRAAQALADDWLGHTYPVLG